MTTNLSPRIASHLAEQVRKAWPTLAESPEAFALGEVGLDPAHAAHERGWTIVVPGRVSIARGDDTLYAVGLHRDVPTAAPVGEVGPDDGAAEAA